MLEKKVCSVCNIPDLCIIACPHNRVLDQMRQPICEPLPELPEIENGKFEIVAAEDQSKEP